MNPRFLVVPTLLVAGLCASAGTAHAAGCTASYSSLTRNVIVQACNADPDAPVGATISRTEAGAILLDGNPIAGNPTVTNTDGIVYHGDPGNNDEITLDMSNGRFAPGFSDEPAGLEKGIEIDIDGGSGPLNFLTVIGSDGAETDRFEVGSTGIDLDDDGDRDIDYTNVHRLTIDAQGGNDTLAGIGFESSPAVSQPLTLRGGPGDDQITGGIGSDELDGGAGTDQVSEYGAGDVTLTDAAFTGNATDALSGFERATVAGASGSDTIDASAFNGPVELIGGGGSDTLIGGPLQDRLRGGEGDDTVRGGPGSDQVVEVVENGALTDTTLTGLGTDTLESIERGYLVGSQGDNRIDASAFSGYVELLGYQGSDVVIAGTGGSWLYGGSERDELVGGPGVDVFVAGTGDDSISSRDTRSEQVNCGDGTDSAVADNLDGLTACEQIDRGTTQPNPGDPADPGADVLAPALSKHTLARRAVRFTLSERAAVTLRLERRVGKRWVRMRGRLTHAGVEGRNKVVLRGRLARRTLAAGRYRLVARASDTAGNRSAARRAGFRIIRR